MQHFQQELSGVRTGRANPGLIENLLVDAEGDHIPIKGCGTVTVRNPQLLAVVMYDPAVSRERRHGAWQQCSLSEAWVAQALARALAAIPVGCSSLAESSSLPLVVAVVLRAPLPFPSPPSPPAAVQGC